MNNILNINYEKHLLDNGLQVILYKDNSLPIVSVNLWYKVGSAYETKGKTGFAHLFEHMMFQGSENVKKEEHFKYVQEAGGSLNGSTSFDKTNYYETVPSNYLDMALWLESDRLGYMLQGLTQEKLDNQKDVVMNERKQRYDNQPYGRSWEILFSSVYPESHPYSWPTIGWMEDIKSYNLDDVKNFFKKYYVPNNASLVVAGDIDYEKALESVKKFFGEIPKGSDVEHPPKQNSKITENKFVTHEDNVQLTRLYLAWNSDHLYGTDDAKLDLLSDILTGSKNSRLYKSLVFEKQIVQDISAFQYSADLQGTFFIIATAKPGVETAKIKEEIFLELEKLISDGVNDDELSRSVNSYKSSYIYSLQNIEVMADHINNYNCHLGEPNSFVYDLERYNQVTTKDITECVKSYLKQPFVELIISPKPQEAK
ncbi:MAG: insulinase family protein [Bacteroidetes bacterium]|nr:insulinase family protein [Bacteroidota bacterium]